MKACARRFLDARGEVLDAMLQKMEMENYQVNAVIIGCGEIAIGSLVRYAQNLDARFFTSKMERLDFVTEQQA